MLSNKEKAKRIVNYLVEKGYLKEIPIVNLNRPWEFRGSWYRNAWEKFLTEALDKVFNQPWVFEKQLEPLLKD